MLRELTVVNFRNIERIDFSPGSGINFIFGDNGAGKSSLLEAVDFLSRGRTFRTRLSRALIREGSGGLVVSATLEDGRRLGTRREAGEASPANRGETRLDGEDVSTQAEMAAALPVAVFHAGAQRLAQSESRHWRNTLDWGVFHVKPAFRGAWQTYSRALRQRNALLRASSSSASLAQWGGQMAAQAATLDSNRRDYAEKLIASAGAAAAAQGVPLEIKYVRGWPEGSDLSQVLAEAEPGDRRIGYTRQGPHRATLRLSWDGAPATERASRGQQRSIAALLMLAQIRLFTELSGRRCVVMVDDLAAEFDEHRRRWLLEGLAQTGQQVFVTAADEALKRSVADDVRMFHMKHGRLVS